MSVCARVQTCACLSRVSECVSECVRRCVCDVASVLVLCLSLCVCAECACRSACLLEFTAMRCLCVWSLSSRLRAACVRELSCTPPTTTPIDSSLPLVVALACILPTNARAWCRRSGETRRSYVFSASGSSSINSRRSRTSLLACGGGGGGGGWMVGLLVGWLVAVASNLAGRSVCG